VIVCCLFVKGGGGGEKRGGGGESNFRDVFTQEKGEGGSRGSPMIRFKGTGEGKGGHLRVISCDEGRGEKRGRGEKPPIEEKSLPSERQKKGIETVPSFKKRGEKRKKEERYIHEILPLAFEREKTPKETSLFHANEKERRSYD